MTEREALKLTLAALKQIDEAMPFPVAKLAIMEAEKALAQPEQESVAMADYINLVEKYAALLSVQPEQEPLAWMSKESKWRLKQGGNSKGAVPVHKNKTTISKIPLYTTPPQRTWVGLTDDEKEKFVIAYYPSNWDRKTAVALMNNYEAYLKEKNT